MVDADGLPVPVKCKLARNPQSRREVVGQIVDYVSILTAMTVDELDEGVQGKLEEALRTFDTAGADPEGFDHRWQQVGTSLRAGQARYVIVVDEAPPDLERIVRFLIQRSELDIRLVRVSRYPDPAGPELYVSTNLVDIAPSERTHGTGDRKAPSVEFQAVLDAYAGMATGDLQLLGRAANYRQIRPSDWPRGLHYEFMSGREYRSVEFHIESVSQRPLGEVIRKMSQEKIPGYPYPLEWDPKWSQAKGRIRSLFQDTIPATDVAAAMCQLINATRDRITAAVSKPATPRSPLATNPSLSSGR